MRLQAIRSQAGFALVDMLIGIVVAAMAMTLLGALFGMIRDASARVERGSASLELMGGIGGLFMRSTDRMIAGLEPGTGSGLVGTTESVRFMAFPPTGSAAEGPVAMEFHSGPNEGLEVVVWKDADTREAVLVEKGLVAHFQFVGRKPGGAVLSLEQHWEPDWPLPVEIAMTLTSRDGSQQDFVARPKANVPLRCAIPDAMPACGGTGER